MNEEIDVSECRYYRKNKECDIWGIPCQMKEFCYFKILKQENAELKEAFKKAKEVIAYCYDEEKPFTSCIDCKYYEECKIQPVDYALRIIDEVLKDD